MQLSIREDRTHISLSDARRLERPYVLERPLKIQLVKTMKFLKAQEASQLDVGIFDDQALPDHVDTRRNIVKSVFFTNWTLKDNAGVVNYAIYELYQL